MTTMTAPVAATAEALRPGRIAMAAVMVLAPVMMLLQTALDPYGVGDSSSRIVAKSLAHTSAVESSLWFGALSALLIIPASLLVSLLAARNRSRLGMAALVLLLFSWTAAVMSPPTDILTLGGHAKSVDAATITSMIDGSQGLAQTSAVGLFFVFSHVIGMIMLGIALLRGRVLPAWACWLVVIDAPLEVVGYSGNLNAVVLVANAVLTVAFGVAALKVLRGGVGWAPVDPDPDAGSTAAART